MENANSGPASRVSPRPTKQAGGFLACSLAHSLTGYLFGPVGQLRECGTLSERPTDRPTVSVSRPEGRTRDRLPAGRPFPRSFGHWLKIG